MRRRLLFVLLFALLCMNGGAQIVNHLKADRATYLTYAGCRMRPFSSDNMHIADSLYADGVAAGDYKKQAYALHIMMSLYYTQRDTVNMNRCFREIRQIVGDRKDARTFWLGIQQEWCTNLIMEGRSADAMLEARAMQRQAIKDNNYLGKLYAHKIIGLIQSQRNNSALAADNFLKAVTDSKSARAEQETPFLYILLAQEYINMGKFADADYYCGQAEKYLSIYNKTLPLKALRLRTLLYCARGWNNSFWDSYETLVNDPLYDVQVETEDRLLIKILFLRSKGMFQDAIASADSLGNPRTKHDLKHGLYASQGDYLSAYSELEQLMGNKDSTYIKVQNEDLAILDAEMNNAQLREEAQKLKAQNQATILIGFLVMFAIAFFAILLSQWQLRENLEQMRRKNSEILRSRHDFQKAMEAKEAEVNSKLQLLQNRTTNVLTGYEEYLDY